MAGKPRMSRKDEEKKSDVVEKEPKKFRKSPARQETKRDVEVLDFKRSVGRPKSPARKTSPPRRGSPGRGRPKRQISPTHNKSTPTKESTSTKVAAPRSPSRKAATTPKSPSRKSPVRKLTNTRSPARPPIKRTTEQVTMMKPIVKLSPIQLDSDSDSDSEPITNIITRMQQKRTPSKEGSVESINNVITRRSMRLREVDRIVHLKSNYEPITKLTEFSDEDEFDIKKNDEVPQQLKPKPEGSSTIGALLNVLFMISLYFGLLILCNDKECSFKIPNLARFKDIDTYFDLSVFLSYTAYFLLIMILSAIPFGGKKCNVIVAKYGKLNYVMNGFLISIIILALFIVLELNNIKVSNYIYDNFFKLSVSGFLLTYPVAVILFIKGNAANHYSMEAKKPALMRFLNGTETVPRLFGIVDIKLVTFRAAAIALQVAATCLIFQSLGLSSDKQKLTDKLDWTALNYNPTLLTICSMYVFYMMDIFAFEQTWLYTLEMQQETMGYLKCMEYFSFVSLYALIPKFVLDYNVQLATWKLILSAIIFIIGYIFYRGSNSQKHSFRDNPYSPLVAHLESIPTSSGKKLICSGFWGIVRHPNYLGDILMHFAFLPFVMCNPPCIIIYLTALGLVYRASKDNKQCKERYGSAWERYCQRVKYLLIPKIY